MFNTPREKVVQLCNGRKIDHQLRATLFTQIRSVSRRWRNHLCESIVVLSNTLHRSSLCLGSINNVQAYLERSGMNLLFIVELRILICDFDNNFGVKKFVSRHNIHAGAFPAKLAPKAFRSLACDLRLELTAYLYLFQVAIRAPCCKKWFDCPEVRI